MPKQSGKMSARERLVCSRVREIRIRASWSQADFAEALGISKDTLASIEYGRTPLRYNIAVRICRKFDFQPAWLATGMGADRPFARVAWLANELEKLDENDLLTAVYDSSPDAFERLRGNTQPSFLLSYNIPDDEQAEFILKHSFMEWTEGTEFKEPSDALRFAIAVSKYGNSTLDSFRSKGLAIRTQVKQGIDSPVVVVKTRKEMLTDSEIKLKKSAVKPRLPELIERLKKATAESGKKSELANFLKQATGGNVPLASVSRWLSGEREPGGEIALQLDAWATAQGFPRAK